MNTEQALGEDNDEEVEGGGDSSDDDLYDFGNGLSAGMREFDMEEDGTHFEITEYMGHILWIRGHARVSGKMAKAEPELFS